VHRNLNLSRFPAGFPSSQINAIGCLARLETTRNIAGLFGIYYLESEFRLNPIFGGSNVETAVLPARGNCSPCVAANSIGFRVHDRDWHLFIARHPNATTRRTERGKPRSGKPSTF